MNDSADSVYRPHMYDWCLCVKFGLDIQKLAANKMIPAVNGFAAVVGFAGKG